MQGGPSEQFHGSAETAEMRFAVTTCTENSGLPARCESEFSKGPLRVSNFFLKCRSERRS
jgi:ABC-type tungstate transport system permease subunit